MDYSQFLYMIPEAVLVAILVIVLIADFASAKNEERPWFNPLMCALMVVQLGLTFIPQGQASAFGGMYYAYPMASVMKTILSAATLIVIIMSRQWLRREDSSQREGEFYMLMLSTLLGMFYGSQLQAMPPKLHSTNFEGMQLIRPLYLVRESDICAWRDYNDLHFLQCACHFTDTCTTCHEDGTTSSKRLETKKLIAELKKSNPFVESNIFRSMENVNLDTVIEYKKKGVRHHFLDEY